MLTTILALLNLEFTFCKIVLVGLQGSWIFNWDFFAQNDFLKIVLKFLSCPL